MYLTHWELDRATHCKICLFYKQIELLEWADDLQMHHLKGYGETLNYRMGVPLLEDVVQSMDRAMATLKGVLLFFTKEMF